MQHARVLSLLAVLLLLGAVGVGRPVAAHRPPQARRSDIVVSQVYGGGGNTAAKLR